MTKRPTRLAQSGLFPIGGVTLPATPAINATTVMVDNVEALAAINSDSLGGDRRDIYANFYYGGVGTPTTAALENLVAMLEGGEQALVTPSGQSAIVATLSALLGPRDHLLVVDTVTFTTRWWIDRMAARTGVEVTYYPPEIAAEIGALLRANTRAILMELPGSFTFETQPVAEICAIASARGVLTVLDNSWAASTFFAPFDHGVDVSLLSLTKCHIGPSGVSMGAVVTKDAALGAAIRNEAALQGLYVSSDACAKAMAMLATLELRVVKQDANARAALRALQELEEVSALFHPSLPRARGHEIWKRDFHRRGAADFIHAGERLGGRTPPRRQPVPGDQDRLWLGRDDQPGLDIHAQRVARGFQGRRRRAGAAAQRRPRGPRRYLRGLARAIRA